jgi:methylmalonyl-CoA/ethylmalonyl-CoA epimerase
MARPTGLAHISLAVTDAEATAARFAELFGATVRSRESLADRALHVIFLDLCGVPIELVQPFDPHDESNPVSRFLKRRGPGLHHIALAVPDAAAALQHAKGAGAELVDETPRPGAHGTRVGFLQPRSTGGALIEFVEGE